MLIITNKNFTTCNLDKFYKIIDANFCHYTIKSAMSILHTTVVYN